VIVLFRDWPLVPLIILADGEGIHPAVVALIRDDIAVADLDPAVVAVEIPWERRTGEFPNSLDGNAPSRNGRGG
jgi:hypothetical protein